MIDFYFANSCCLEFPIESDYIGAISRKEFELMEDIITFSNRLGVEFSAHSDFFIGNEDLIKLYDFVLQLEVENQSKEVLSARINFSAIIKNAINMKRGVYAFCD